MLTKSEILFLHYCKLRGYVTNRLSAPADGGRFPDYEVIIGTNRIIVEIKELQPNPMDKNMAEAIRARSIQVFGDEMGRRVRTHVEDAEHQLRRYESQRVPCMVVLYDNIIVNGFRPNPPELFPVDVMNPLHPSHIEVGMYGHQVAQVRIHPDWRTESLGDVRGNKRTLRSGHQDNISAVATLHDYDSSNGLFLVVYHNFFAKNPLSKFVFTDTKDRQIENPGHPDSCPGSLQRVQI
jgi:hypothetical protein